MPDIEVKTTMQMMDEYWTTMMRCWVAQEKLMDKSLSIEERLIWAERAQEQNSKRTELIRALDKRLNSPGFTNTSKTYHTYFKEENK